ncbi:MAG TPA: ATP-dependent 6-phosphofructokinase [Tepidiformaceae bacterium]|nr:ATP-dependent 6-phosphofructokinase [Tepidiformaceae bacterium]
MQKIGILTSGGDAPGMNAAIRAAVRAATSCGVTVLGYRDGFRGLLANNSEELDDRAVGNILQRGGTVLGTSRCDEFLQSEARAVAAAHIRQAGIGGLVVVGGDGSFRGALALAAEHAIPVVGVPATIDNDIAGTEDTIGFDTAVNTAVFAIDQVRDTSESTGMMFFVEVMGRHSGMLALATAVAAGASGVLVPEARDELQHLVRRLRRSFELGKHSHIIVVAEGEEAGGAFAVAERVGKELDHPYRVVVLGHVQRGGRPTAHDRIVASEMGARAVQALAAGRSLVMVAVREGRMCEVPLATGERMAPAGDELLALAQTLAG